MMSEPIQDPRQALSAIQSEIERRRYLKDPALWINERLGEFTWSKQREICDAIANHRRVAVHTAHNLGKSFIASRIIAWWIECHPPGSARAVSSAPSDRQVRAIMWNDLNKIHARGNLRGRMTQREWWIKEEAGNDSLVAFGAKPGDLDMEGFQGIHAPYVLCVFDESCGMPIALWHAADSLIANDNSRFLAIGNPDDPTSEFCEICKPGSGWHVIGISAYDTPNFTGEEVPKELADQIVGRTWAKEKELSWGRDNSLFISKVLGQFPEISIDGLIPINWIRDAQDRELPPAFPIELGVDVGGGADKTVVALRRGPHVRVIHKDQNPNTMETAGKIASLIKAHSVSACKIDEIGIGKGVVDRLQEQVEEGVLDCDIIGINVGQPPSEEGKTHFVNLRAEYWWAMRDRFQSEDDGSTIDIDPADDVLAGQLADIKFKRTSRGHILIESKKDMKKRGKNSPDEGDAIMLAFAEPIEEDQDPIYTRATWGRRSRRFL